MLETIIYDIGILVLGFVLGWLARSHRLGKEYKEGGVELPNV